MKSSSLAFRPWEHGGLRLRNRIVMAPMTRRKAADDGIPTAAIVEYYRRRAAGEVGLIISEGTHVDALHAPDTFNVPRFETEAQWEGWRRVVEAVHSEGGAFAPQLWHTGPLAADPIGPTDAERPARKDGRPRSPVRAMGQEDFEQVVKAFEKAARAAQAIGCDALEIHGAHGYLLDSFVGEANRRNDEYGGSLSNRLRFPLQVVRKVREAVGPDFPIIYRFSQWSIGNYTEQKVRSPEELQTMVCALRDAGVTILHVSTRRAVDAGFPDRDERSLAGWTRLVAEIPVIAVGSVSVTLPLDQAYGKQSDRVSDPTAALRLLDEGEADLLAVGRALIANPEWVKTVRDGDWRSLKTFNKEMLASLD